MSHGEKGPVYHNNSNRRSTHLPSDGQRQLNDYFCFHFNRDVLLLNACPETQRCIFVYFLHTCRSQAVAEHKAAVEAALTFGAAGRCQSLWCRGSYPQCSG